MPIHSLTVQSSTRTSFPGSDAHYLLDLVNRLARIVAGQMPGCLLSAPAVKAGTSAATAWRSEAFTLNARGKTFAVSAQEKALTATSHDIAASKEAWYVLSVQVDGSTFTITKGADQTIGTKVLPVTPDNEIAVGYMQIITGSGGIFDASSDDLAVGGNVATINFFDAPHVTVIGDEAGTEIAV